MRDNDEIIFEKIEIVNAGARQFCRRTHPVGKTEGGCVLFPRWAVPAPLTLLITERLFVGQLVELLFRLPFLPAHLVFANHKEIRRMKGRRLAPGGRLIAELEGRRLIVELLYLRVVFHQVDRTEFDGMALELDR